MSCIISIAIQQDVANSLTLSRKVATRAEDPQLAMTRLIEVFGAITGGSLPCKVTVGVEDDTGTISSNTITCDQSAATADDVVSIGGVDLTAKASGAATNEFNIGASDAEMATNLAGAINAASKLQQYITASAASGTVTVTANFPGSWCDLITCNSTVSSGAPFVFASATLTGANATQVADPITYSLGA